MSFFLLTIYRSHSNVDGSHLSNPRTISRTLFNDVDRPHPNYNLLFMQFGQFITHDVTRSSSITTCMYSKIFFNYFCNSPLCIETPYIKSNNVYTKKIIIILISVIIFIHIRTADGKDISCCTEDGSAPLSPNQRHYACLPIEIEPHDEFYEHFKQGCMNFVRSALAPDAGCKLGYGKQVHIQMKYNYKK